MTESMMSAGQAKLETDQGLTGFFGFRIESNYNSYKVNWISNHQKYYIS